MNNLFIDDLLPPKGEAVTRLPYTPPKVMPAPPVSVEQNQGRGADGGGKFSAS